MPCGKAKNKSSSDLQTRKDASTQTAPTAKSGCSPTCNDVAARLDKLYARGFQERIKESVAQMESYVRPREPFPKLSAVGRDDRNRKD